MLQSVDLVWLYVGAVGILACAALAFDLIRAFSRRRGQSAATDAGTDRTADGIVPGHRGEVTRESPTRVLRRLARSPATVRSGGNGRGSVVPAAPATGPDREFLPAALEILETPPSPVAMSLMVTICALVVAALAWSYFGWLDIHAVAHGKVQPSGRTKIVQPLDAGKVAGIHVEAGRHVSEGQLLVELDPTETVADVVALERELESATAETVRRRAAIAAAQSGDWSQRPVAFPELVTLPVQMRERSLLDAELDQLEAVATSLKSQLAERRATQERLQGSIDARKRLLDLARERVGMREEIQARGAGSRALIIEAQMQYENYVTADAADRGQLIEVAAAVRSLDRRIEQAVTQFVADQTQKLVDVNRRRDRLEQEIVKARARRDRTRLRAPIDGTVQQLAVSTLGQVVSSGQPLMSVVPRDAPLEVEAMIANKDIGFVRVGQQATVKVEAFPFTRYGVIEAEVVKVSNDAVDEGNATAMMDAAQAARPQGGNGMSRTGQSLVFPATLRLSKSVMRIDGKDIPLSPGMAVTVEIKTGERRAISYLLSPLGELLASSGRER